MHPLKRTPRVGQMLDYVPHRHDVEMSLWQVGGIQRPLHHVKPTRLCLLHRPAGRLQAPGIPAVAARDLDKDPRVAAHVQQRATTWRPCNPLQRLQVVLEGQHPPLPLLQVERILDRLVGIDDVVLIQPGVGVDQATFLTLDDGVMPAVAAVGTGIGGPVTGGFFYRAGVTHDGVIGSAQIAAHILHQAGLFAKRFGASRSTVPNALKISFLETLEAPRRRSSKMMGTSPTFQPRLSTRKSISNKKE